MGGEEKHSGYLLLFTKHFKESTNFELSKTLSEAASASFWKGKDFLWPL